MSLEWLIESLAELKAYAEGQNLPVLAAQIDIAMQLAHLESAQDETFDSAASPDHHTPLN